MARIVGVDSLFSSQTSNPSDNPGPGIPISTTKVLLIDGNRNNRSVLFSHDAHIRKNTKAPNCGFCHHMNLTAAQVSEGFQCHQDMYLETDIFDHVDHIAAEGGNRGCDKCHTNAAVGKNRETSVPCSECHKTMRI